MACRLVLVAVLVAQLTQQTFADSTSVVKEDETLASRVTSAVSRASTRFLSDMQLATEQDPMTTQMTGQAGEVDVKDSKKPSVAEKGAKKKQMIRQWFTWPFWRLMVYCSLTILVFCEIICPVIFAQVGLGLLLASTLFLIQNLSLLTVAIIFADGKSAGVGHILSLCIVMAAISLLLFLGALSLKFKKMSPSATKMTHDLALVFRPISLLTVVFLIVNAILEETAADWGNLALLVAMLALGVAFAMAGVVKDMMCYMLIRANDYFEEKDFIYHGGELVQVQSVHWCHTVCFRLKTKSPMYIPNSKLAAGINNQSQDNGRTFEIDFGISGDLKADQAATVVKEFWALIRGIPEDGFTGLNGNAIANQIDKDKSVCFLNGGGDNIHVKLVGKYFFSSPPEGGKGEKIDRQLEWQGAWNYQIEWFVLEAKKIVAKNK